MRATTLLSTAAAALLLTFAPPLQARDFKVPSPGYEWTFPRDHADHPAYAVEWWYYTGHLLPKGADPSDDSAWMHLQLTFFRNSLPGEGSGRLYFGHYAMSGGGQPFRFSEAIARGTLGEAGADSSVYCVWLDNWSAQLIGGSHVLEAEDSRVGGIRLLATPKLGPVLNGDHGYSPKGTSGGEASYYYSIPVLATEGWVQPPAPDEGPRPAPVEVSGTLWMDHEFGNQQLGSGLVGWDWWGLELPGGDALMFYRIRRADGTPIDASEGTFVAKDGSVTRLALADVTIETTGQWTSPESGITYPHGWTLSAPSVGVEITLTPTTDDQELRTDRSTRVTYYEGAVSVQRKGYDQRTFGYVELVGYGKKDVKPAE